MLLLFRLPLSTCGMPSRGEAVRSILVAAGQLRKKCGAKVFAQGGRLRQKSELRDYVRFSLGRLEWQQRPSPLKVWQQPGGRHLDVVGSERPALGNKIPLNVRS